MKTSTNKVIYLVGLFAVLCTLNAETLAKQNDITDFRAPMRSLEISKMQDFHLQNAKLKINQDQFSYAWGDLAYILCQIPNHHVALKEMLRIAPELHKENELRKYFEKAVRLFPDDMEVQAMYAAFNLSSSKKSKQ